MPSTTISISTTILPTKSIRKPTPTFRTKTVIIQLSVSKSRLVLKWKEEHFLSKNRSLKR